MKSKLSVFIITYNEERILEKCLKKLYWAEEIVVVDSGSTDATLEICKKYGANVFYKEFNGFGKQKQFALEQTTNNWVLSLDADEILSDDLISEIKDLLKSNSNVYGYFIKRKHVFLGNIFNFGHESKQYILRFFDKRYGKFNNLDVHESILVQGKTKKINSYFLHFSYASLETYVTKLNRYTELYAKTKAAKNKNYNIIEIVFKVKFEFFKKYILELNFLNGIAGFHWAYLAGVYTYIKCIKTNELNVLNKKT